MAANPRDTARQWLAERYDHAKRNCLDRTRAAPCQGCLTDAILTDVEVTTILRPIDDSRRTALLLPAEEGTGT